MRVVGLDGRTAPWKLAGCRVLGDETRPRSGPHRRARALLKEMFPADVVLEEVPIPGSRLRGDFYVSTRTLMVEVHGAQHFRFIPHFHGSRGTFERARRNDADKRRFCDDNGITLVVLRDDEDDETWRRTLTNTPA